jgi:hypothetical protein
VVVVIQTLHGQERHATITTCEQACRTMYPTTTLSRRGLLYSRCNNRTAAMALLVRHCLPPHHPCSQVHCCQRAGTSKNSSR